MWGHFVQQTTGVVDWEQGGAFTFEFEEERAVAIRHRSVEFLDMPDWMYIPAGTKLAAPAIDLHTRFDKEPPLPLYTISPKSRGPNAHVFDRKGKATRVWVERSRAALQASRLSTGTGSASSQVQLRVHTKAQRTAGLAKARAKLESMPKRARTIAIADALPDGADMA